MLKARLYLIALTIVCFGACKQAPKIETDTQLDIRISKDPDRLNPIIYPKPGAGEIYSYIFVSPVDKNPITLEMKPVLTTALPKKTLTKEGDIAYTFTFHDRAIWPDGLPVTGEDYLFTLKTINHPAVNAPTYRSTITFMERVIVDSLNPKKITIVVNEDLFQTPEYVAGIEIYPKHIYDPEGLLDKVSFEYLKDKANYPLIDQDSSLSAFAQAFNSTKYSQEAVVGAGPYQLKSYNANGIIRLSKVPGFWADSLANPHPVLQGYAEELVFHVIADDVAAQSLLKEGDIDVLPHLEIADYQNLINQQNTSLPLSYLTPNIPRIYYLMLNTESPELQDRIVRQALHHAVDLESIIKALDGGQGTPMLSNILPTEWYYNKQLSYPEFNIARAAQLLDQAGWKNKDGDGTREKIIKGKKTPLVLKAGVTPGKLSADIMQIIKQDAAKAGIQIELIEKDSKLFMDQNISTGDYHIAPLVVNRTLLAYDPYYVWHSDNKNKGTNYSGYHDNELDQVIEQIRSGKLSRVQLERAYHRFQEIIHRDRPMLFLYSPVVRIASNSDWKLQSTLRRPGFLANTAKFQPDLVE